MSHPTSPAATTEPTTIDKLRGLRWSYLTNAANTVFVQFVYFGSVFVLFLNELALTKTQIGFVLALIPFAACLAPFIAPWTARVGYKRIFVLFFGARKATTLLLLLTPWVLGVSTAQGVFWFVTAVVALFAVTRAIEETAYFPWVQEFVPNAVRGKYAATSNILSGVAGFAAVGVAGLVLDQIIGLNGFMLLFGVSIVFGVVSVWASAFIPGGAPNPTAARGQRDLRAALADTDFRRYLLGLALITLGTVPLASFLPLFMQEEVGLSAGNVVLLQMGTLLGTLTTSYLWGWAADRYGSKPIMLSGLTALVLLPMLWWLLPKGSPISLPVALAIAFVQGSANLGWGIGAGRLLFVSIVPADKKSDYMALYFAWTGIVTGVSQFVGGRALDFSQGISGQFLFLRLDAYTPLFLAAVMLPLLSISLLHAIRGDSPFSTTQFAGFFLRGNPVLALNSLVRFYRARDEHSAVLVTERMGEIRSPLAVDELLDALIDPRFNVRFEAILAVARMPADPRLTDALIAVLEDDSPALSVVAAWALGKIGGSQPTAHDALRAALQSQYRSVQAHAVRALGSLADTTVADALLQQLEHETDDGLRMACASTLGKLGVSEAIGPLLQLLDTSPDETMRAECALALARIAGNETDFIRLFRQMKMAAAVTSTQVLTQIERRFAGTPTWPGLRDAIRKCAELCAQDQIKEAAMLLGEALQPLPAGVFDAERSLILASCAHEFVHSGVSRREYWLLALHLLGGQRPTGRGSLPISLDQPANTPM
ncbi:MAG: MFS transporter [Caldilineaceae bacterium]|nr:MFS transporter [Caldilineaceae bacterium]